MTGPKVTRKRDPRARHSQRAQALAKQLKAAKARQAEEAKAKAEQAQALYQSRLLSTRIKLWATADGEDATELLAALMVVIGTPCEAGSRIYGRTDWVRQLHGALRILADMCLQSGYRWRADMAPALDRAIDLAEEHSTSMRHTRDMYEAWVEANGAAAMVLRHTLDAEAIARGA